MTRGDVITVSLGGDHGKPRPAIIVHSDLFAELSTVTVLPLTSALQVTSILRVSVQPDENNGLQKPSQIMVDKPQTPAATRLGSVIGRLDPTTMRRVDDALARYLGL